MISNHYNLIVIGGGAAGFFCAINYVEKNEGARVIILEASHQVLSKVRISGGGRCNVTNVISDPIELSKYYPRGERELIGPFNRFCSEDTRDWFEQRGVMLKVEDDGRVFPESNQSESIIDCLLQLCKAYKIEIETSSRVKRFKKQNSQWQIETITNDYITDALFIATGSDARIWDELDSLGHSIVSAVPSLFTFNIKEIELNELTGISVPKAICKITKHNLVSSGPLLITHWGLSGPAILKLSAWGARDLYDDGYRFDLNVNWIDISQDEAILHIKEGVKNIGNKLLCNSTFFNIPMRLWKYFCQRAMIDIHLTLPQMSLQQIKSLSSVLTNDIYRVEGKSIFKEEFVTAGGIQLKEINFKSFESKICPGLYLAGEVLNIDAITGGFNFQAAWTGAYIASQSIPYNNI